MKIKPYVINAINASILVIMGLWGYYGSQSPSPTAFIPVLSGVILLFMANGMKKGNRVIAHIVVVITLLTFIALFKPLSGAIARSDSGAITRVTTMMIFNFFALVVYLKSFIDARRNVGIK